MRITYNRHLLFVHFLFRIHSLLLAIRPPSSEKTLIKMSQSIHLFEEVCSTDFLSFSFGGRGYQDQLYDSIAKTNELAGVKVSLLPPSSECPTQIVWVSHNFGFLGGSLGCAEGEKITRAFEYAIEKKLPICVQCKTGGARMQEGVSSLMQMAKVSVAVESLRRAKLPFVSILNDPTYGGVSASYAMQADVKIATSDARIGFAGPQVILNTMCEANQAKFDKMCPSDFQSASYLLQYGQVDMVLEAEPKSTLQSRLEVLVGSILSTLMFGKEPPSLEAASSQAAAEVTQQDKDKPFDYMNSRYINRPQTQDIIAAIFDDFIELSGDGRVGKDTCIRGGIAHFLGRSCVVLGTFKGHTPQAMQEANYGMASPHGYRTALRLMQLAERFGMPVVTLVDTVGAWPTFECEKNGQSEAIATNLTSMAGLTVPIITLMVGEGGSGGALGIGMGNAIGMLSGGYFGVISPEGAASILGRYKDELHKAKQFPLDCQALAKAQCIYAYQLKEIGVVDEIIWESAEGEGETFKSFPILTSRIRSFLATTMSHLLTLSSEDIVNHRYIKFRALGTFSILSPEERIAAVELAIAKRGPLKNLPRNDTSPTKLISHIAEETVSGAQSRYRQLAPATCPLHPPSIPKTFKSTRPPSDGSWENAKSILDSGGPEKLSQWVKAQSRKRVLVTDTTMRDAHQSLIATRARTEDLVKGAIIANEVLRDAFSFEAWGGATFDVCMRFLDECPWERLREIRRACPDVCLQMLIRGANAVGYTSYPDNVVTEFVRLAALNGMDIFRIFDCFNIVDNMRVSIDAVRAVGKVAEVCLCYTGNLLQSSIYTVDYYKNLAKEAADAGAHIIGIKDMAGLLRPLEVAPLLNAIREVTDLPIHFHTHATSSGALATCLEMARCGCDIIDFATASMADGTSQPSLNAFVAMMEGAPNDTGINYLNLEVYDMYWAKVRDMYSPFESGMKSGSARVYEHQIPGGQYSNLIVQCQSMGLWGEWEAVLDAYRDVNRLLGDIVKVTPSSKCVGDLALYLVTRQLKADDLLDESKAASIDFPESVVGLMKGELGFPHMGFPLAVEKAILKGAPKLTTRAGLSLAPADFESNCKRLSAEWGGISISPEQGMSSLMYPKVFADYMKRIVGKGPLLRYLPTPVYFYAMEPGQSFTFNIPSRYLGDVVKGNGTSSINVVDVGDEEVLCEVTVTLARIGPLQHGHRALTFTITYDGREQTQTATVKDTSGAFVFDGPMANPAEKGQIASPMPGTIEKLLVKEGQTVSAGEMLCTVSAMKMEVKVTAPEAGKVLSLNVTTGTRVVEGALLMTLS